jgi:acetyl esterase/lipase
VCYCDDKEARHRLDLYVPKNAKNFPVLMFVHGGGWKNGDKAEFEFLGQALAAEGIGLASINYRLYPRVKFPANVEDVAQAFAWLHKNIARHGGRPDQLFVAGHSSGGHLVSLLATDKSYLQKVGLSPDKISGVVSISGLYSIPKGRFPLFENTEEAVRKASPVHQITGKTPPFLLVYADRDFPHFGEMAEDFARALRGAKCDVTCMEIKERTHGSVAARIENENDPVRKAIVAFVTKSTKSAPK